MDALKPLYFLFFLVIVFFALQAKAQINLPSSAKIDTNLTKTNIGIGTASYPANMLQIQSPSLLNTQERLFRTTVDDAQHDFMQILNGSALNNTFAPVLWGHRESLDNNGNAGYGLTIMGSCNTINDVLGSPAILQFEARAYNTPGRLMGVAGHPEIKVDPADSLTILNRPLFDWTTLNNVKMRMMSNGTLGIGNTAPYLQSKLDVGGDVVIGSIFTGENRLLLHTRSWFGGDFFALVPTFPNQSTNFDFGNALYIVPGKGIGIGTSNIVGNAKFAVAGKMYAEQIVVKLQANWPDNVFSHPYKLRSLDELDSYIKLEKHLPEVPSEKEVKENGIDIENMQKIEMQKIEELSLYIISIHKENEALQKKVELLEKKVKSFSEINKDQQE